MTGFSITFSIKMTRYKHQLTPMEVAYLSMCDRLDRFACILTDPHVDITDKQADAIRRAAVAIEEEWILEPSLRSSNDDD